MGQVKRLAGVAALILGLLALNWWATAMQQGITARPDLRNYFLYRRFSVYYPVVIEIGRWIILATSLNLINGLAGQFSLGHAAFAAIGGYTSAAITVFIGQRYLGTQVSWPPGAAPASWNCLFA